GVGVNGGDGVFGAGDAVGVAAERGGIGAVVRGVARVDRREPVGDRGGHRLGDAQVVEDVLVAWLPVVLEKRVGIDRLGAGLVGQHVVDPSVVAAAVEDDQGGVGDRGGVRGAGLVGVRVGFRPAQDRLDRHIGA